MTKTTTKALGLITDKFTKIELAKELGITRPTLDKRLTEETKWKTLEIKWINKLSK